MTIKYHISWLFRPDNGISDTTYYPSDVKNPTEVGDLWPPLEV